VHLGQSHFFLNVFGDVDAYLPLEDDVELIPDVANVTDRGSFGELLVLELLAALD